MKNKTLFESLELFEVAINNFKKQILKKIDFTVLQILLFAYLVIVTICFKLGLIK